MSPVATTNRGAVGSFGLRAFRDTVLPSAMRLTSDKHRPSPNALARSVEGVVFVEYVALLTLVTVIGAVAVVGLGVPLLKLYRFAQMVLSLPIP
jgi:hypothetical protein